MQHGAAAARRHFSVWQHAALFRRGQLHLWALVCSAYDLARPSQATGGSKRQAGSSALAPAPALLLCLLPAYRPAIPTSYAKPPYCKKGVKHLQSDE